MRKAYCNYIILGCLGLFLLSCSAQKESLSISEEEKKIFAKLVHLYKRVSLAVKGEIEKNRNIE